MTQHEFNRRILELLENTLSLAEPKESGIDSLTRKGRLFEEISQLHLQLKDIGRGGDNE